MCFSLYFKGELSYQTWHNNFAAHPPLSCIIAEQSSIWSWGGGKRFKRSSLAPVFTTKNERVFCPMQKHFLIKLERSSNTLTDAKNNRLLNSSPLFLLFKLNYIILHQQGIASSPPVLKGIYLDKLYFFGSGYSSHLSGAAVQEANKNASSTCLMFVRGMRAAFKWFSPLSAVMLCAAVRAL